MFGFLAVSQGRDQPWHLVGPQQVSVEACMSVLNALAVTDPAARRAGPDQCPGEGKRTHGADPGRPEGRETRVRGGALYDGP